MKQCKIIVPRLNIRNTAPEVRNDNYIGFLTGGTMFFTEKKVKGQNLAGNDQWYVDQFNRFYWSGGVEELPATEALPPAVAESRAAVHLQRMGIESIWQQGELGQLATVAILDSGIALHCTDLTEAVQQGLPAAIANNRMKNFVADSNTMDDDFGHGSHCAGLIASRNKNEVVGVAPGCKLYVGKIRDQANGPSVANMIAGIRWAAGLEPGSPQDIDIISMSSGSLLNLPDMQPTIDAALQKGKILVFAIGNRSPLGDPTGGFFPAACTGTISVGAVDYNKDLLDFTYQFDNLTICCPGADIVSYGVGGNTRVDSGTSQATALCAGVVALLVSKLKRKNATAIPQKIRELLLSSATKTAPTNYTYRFIDPVQLFHSII